MSERVFITKQFDRPIYRLLQALRVAHGDASQWEVLQAAVVSFGQRSKAERDASLAQVRLAPSDQPEEYPVVP